MTPRPIKQASRAVYTITNPLGATENAMIGAALYSGRPGKAFSGTTGPRATPAPVPGVRAAAAQDSNDRLAALMAVQRERFVEARPLVVPPPEEVDPLPFEREELARRKPEARVWQRKQRKQIAAESRRYGIERAAEAFAGAQAEHQEQQAQADAWWHALDRGDPEVVTAALVAAFADNPAPVGVISAQPNWAELSIHLPGMEVLPDKKAHITPTGRLSAIAWPKAELNEVYANLLGAHLLATIRETWSAAPSLSELRVHGLRTPEARSTETLFRADVRRRDHDWSDDGVCARLLAESDCGLRRVGSSGEVQPWSADDLPPLSPT